MNLIKKLKQNKGFSLVELIVAFAILSIVSLTVLMVMNAGTNMFTTVDKQINIQYKSQAAMAQFQQYFMGCSKAICKTDDDNITWFADDKNVYAIKFSDGKLYFKQATYIQAATLTAADVTDPLCSDVGDFTATIINKGSTATSVKISLTITDNTGKSYTANQVFSFRNSPVYVKESDSEVEGSTLLSTMLAILTGGGD